MNALTASTSTQPDELVSSSRYELLTSLGSGGMASVYLARRRGAAGFERLVAVKRASLRPNEDAHEALRLLADEAAMAGWVRHPNVVSVLDVEEFGGELYLAMEYVEGCALSALLNERDVPASTLARVLHDVCEGLHAIHHSVGPNGEPLGLVHRDLSPQNILVGTDGVARIADFGIAKTALAPRRTAHNSRRGKPGYMAPEYLQSGIATGASDVFALGVILWEALARQRLYGPTQSLHDLRVKHEQPVPLPSALGRVVPRELEQVAMRALRRHPREAAITTARELGAALLSSTHGHGGERAFIASWVERIAEGSLRSQRDAARPRPDAPPSRLMTPGLPPVRQKRPPRALTAVPTPPDAADDTPTVRPPPTAVESTRPDLLARTPPASSALQPTAKPPIRPTVRISRPPPSETPRSPIAARARPRLRLWYVLATCSVLLATASVYFALSSPQPTPTPARSTGPVPLSEAPAAGHAPPR